MRLSRLDFTTVSQDQTARRVISPHFSVVFSTKAQGMAVVVSKKVAKTSVGRHILKRRVRAAACPWFIKHSNTALLIYVRPESQSLSFVDISNEINTLLARLA